MRLHVNPGLRLGGELTVPGDKSIAHRWLILSSTARGRSRLTNVPRSLDIRSTAACLSSLAPNARPSLEVWSRQPGAPVEDGGSTWNSDLRESDDAALEVEGDGRDTLVEPTMPLDCGNAGTAMRLLAGVVASSPFRTAFVGDASLSRRPMERVAIPLRSMGADVRTTDGHAPLTVHGGRLHGIDHRSPVPSAQVKSAVLLAGLAAEGSTTVHEAAATRDHTERAIEALGGTCRRLPDGVSIEPFQHGGFTGDVPGDPSSAAFLLAAVAVTGGELTLRDVGLNPTRLAFLEVLGRMGLDIETSIEREEVGEPVGSIHARASGAVRATRVGAGELPLVIDEVPALALLAAHASADTWFLDAGELRAKESDRLESVAAGIRALGGHAADEGADLVVAGGGLPGGIASSGGDHRLAMALAVAALAADGPSVIDGIEAADVSFPGFVWALRAIGADVEVSA